MGETHGLPLREVVVFLAATAFVVPLASRLRLSPVLGFLVAGLVIGPHGLGRLVDELPWLGSIVIGDPSGPAALAEFGIVFLLFTIGLELSPARLWAMRGLVFGLGSLQVAATAALIAGVAAAFGNPPPAAVVLGACLALSSTAIVTELLRERRRLGSPVGRASFAILLMQDLAVVPILVLVTVFGGGDGGDGRPVAWALLASLGQAALMVAAILALGRIALRPLFRRIVAARSRELFVAATLLVIIATAMATAAAGLSMALGAFLAGLLLAETEYRHAIEADVEPFKGLLLGLFFMSVGMGLDLAAVVAEVGWLLASIVGLYTLKGAVIVGLGLAFGLGWRTAAETGLLLGQAGEFAFVVVAQATVAGLVAANIGQFMQLVAGATMLATPLVAPLAERAGRWLERRAPDLRWTAERVGDPAGHVIVAGYGRVGRMLGELLDRQLVPHVALDLDPDVVRAARGASVHYGDASRTEILGRVGAGRALAVVVTMDDPRAAERVVASVRERWPELSVFARVRDARHAKRLLRLGATRVVPEALEASLQLGEVVLQGVGIPPDAAHTVVNRRREQELTGIETGLFTLVETGTASSHSAEHGRSSSSPPSKDGSSQRP
jgi:CPA2 family monovalent cation:H+ antiporter-2